MQKSIFTLFFSLLILFFVSCDNTGTEPEPLEFVTEPSDDLTQMIEETPSDFTWEYFGPNIQISLQSDNDWEGELVLSGFQIANNEIIDRITTNSYPANSEMLSGDGILGSDLTIDFHVPGWGDWKVISDINLKWNNTKVQEHIELWEVNESWSPSEIEDAILSEVDLEENETLFVVYAQLAGESPEREQTIRPFGLLMREE
ncbi:hypothetical protein LQ318_11010 [Aliifodinibius salicampi]|uniref:Uncharacterized protein n=1 Tax=Fodinibius salicampi TaxID=1920655 RepID=A0ABT3PZY1_9BACT|nr:hypothetical protein [Fodinibius salicampi]MCW9713437.1 hypothetical protein [Fodinibius salicampi]